MVTTWEVVRDRCRRFINDVLTTDRAPRVSDQELSDAWNDVQDDIVMYIARPKSFTIAADQTSARLPDDLYRIDRIVLDAGDDTNHYTITRLDSEGDPNDPNLYEGTYWYMTTDTIVFTQALTYAVTVFYRAYWPEIDAGDLNRPVLIPRWAIQACVYYVAAVCIEKQVISDPQLRQYASRRQDAGTPTSNPFLQVAQYMLERYRQKVYDRTQDVGNTRLEWPSSFR